MAKQGLDKQAKAERMSQLKTELLRAERREIEAKERIAELKKVIAEEEKGG